MAHLCVRKGCGKPITELGDCLYHPGEPIFHEGQKGWECCKPRVLTFDEFLNIPPCSQGAHTNVTELALPVKPEPREVERLQPALEESRKEPIKLERSRADSPVQQTSVNASISDSDSDGSLENLPLKPICKRRSCNFDSSAHTGDTYPPCIYHPGQPLFHEGSKGWTCCKTRVLEFDDFLSIKGCKQKAKHLFIGRKDTVQQTKANLKPRHDYYQTPSTIIASLYLKKIDRENAVVEFVSPTCIGLDLPTLDNTRYQTTHKLTHEIEVRESTFKIMASKLELTLHKSKNGEWTSLWTSEE